MTQITRIFLAQTSQTYAEWAALLRSQLAAAPSACVHAEVSSALLSVASLLDLMRFAHRRGTDYLASRIARRTTPQTPDENLRLKLQDKANWYLKPVSE